MPQPLFCALLASLLYGCGAAPQDPTTDAGAQPRQSQPTVLDPMLQQRERAREQAEAAVEQHRQQITGAIESQER